MYRVISTQWAMIIEDSFKTAEEAHQYGLLNCGENSCWEGDWMVEYYTTNPWVMAV